jgi:hypothetical protein
LKKIITILLLGCLCLNVTGYHIIFQLHKAALKMAMKRMLRRQANSQDELAFQFPIDAPPSPDGPKWEEEHEFSLRGKMYDVIEKKVKNGKLVVRCISDDRETELIAKYQQVLEKSFGHRAKKRSASLLKLIISLFTIPATFMPVLFTATLHNEFSIYRCNLPAACRDVITPPPRFL